MDYPLVSRNVRDARGVGQLRGVNVLWNLQFENAN